MQCEQVYGAAWAFNPARWGTDDGYVPFAVCWVYWRALEMRGALDALSTARAIGLALADGPSAQQARRDAIDEALPKGA